MSIANTMTGWDGDNEGSVVRDLDRLRPATEQLSVSFHVHGGM
jgi:hypothetical protein